MSRNSQLEAENKRLSVKVDEMKDICSLTSSLNVKYRLQLDKETSDKENLAELNQKLKTRLNNLTVKCNELNQKVKVLELNIKRKPAVRLSQQPPVRVISSISDIIIPDQRSNAEFIDLQKRFDELDAEHQEALNVIDDLEFELGDVIASSISRGHFSHN